MSLCRVLHVHELGEESFSISPPFVILSGDLNLIWLLVYILMQKEQMTFLDQSPGSQDLRTPSF